jgi:predicted transcriptional regulator
MLELCVDVLSLRGFSMAAKVNLVLDDEVKEALDELVPAGERSRFANEVLRERLAMVRRRQAIEKLEVLRRAGPHVSTAEILLTLREARDAE